MKTIISSVLLILFGQLAMAQSGINSKLSAADFDQQLQKYHDVQLIDVRTPEEFMEGHLPRAVNANINSGEFAKDVSKLDKNRPVFVYCLSGGRSTKAASSMAIMGFREIYNLDGGILAWINSGRVVTAPTSKHPKKGMTIGSLTAMTKQKKYVIVDYNAKWCGYCGKMLPYLQSLASARKDTVLLVSVDADANKSLLKQKKIAGFPYLELYKNGQLIWHNQGYLDEKTLLQSTKLE